MAFVVTDDCILCKYQDCVEVCPVDCFHEGPNMLVIDPAECIDCSLCEPECEAEAIFADIDLPKDCGQFEALNERLASQWPVISARGEPLKDADQWRGVPDKMKYLVE